MQHFGQKQAEVTLESGEFLPVTNRLRPIAGELDEVTIRLILEYFVSTRKKYSEDCPEFLESEEQEDQQAQVVSGVQQDPQTTFYTTETPNFSLRYALAVVPLLLLGGFLGYQHLRK